MLKKLEDLTLPELFTAADSVYTGDSEPLSQPDRAALIGSYLGVSRPYSKEATELNDALQVTLSDIGRLEPAEQARLLAALAFQVNGQLSSLFS